LATERRRRLAPGGSPSELEAGGSRHHRGSAVVDRVDDLGVVDALEVGRGDAEVGMAELALDHVQRDALAGHLDGVGVTELVRGESAPDRGLDGEAAQLGAHT
jgi:hypothetical protein